MDSILASHPAAPGSNPSIPKRFSDEILKLLRLIDGTAKNSDQRLDNVYQIHLVLASGKLVLQKKFYLLKCNPNLKSSDFLILPKI